MKQTAVEWYGFQIGILISKFFNNEISKSEVHFKRIEIEEQAKEMEREQIIDAHLDGQCFSTTIEEINYAEQYYDETFKQQTPWYDEDQTTKRMDVVDQNGNDGEHYNK
jgi:hypothetical protein